MENKGKEDRKTNNRCRPFVLYIAIGILLAVVVALIIYHDISHAQMKKDLHMVLMQTQKNTKEIICLDSSLYLNETFSEQFKPEYNMTFGTIQVNCWRMTFLKNTSHAFLQKPKTEWKMSSQNNGWKTNQDTA